MEHPRYLEVRYLSKILHALKPTRAMLRCLCIVDAGQTPSIESSYDIIVSLRKCHNP